MRGSVSASELRDAIRSERDDPIVDGAGVPVQLRRVETLADFWQVAQAGQTAAQQLQRTRIVAVHQVMERNANLKDALVEVAHGPRLGPPQHLQGLVTLPVFAAVELRDTPAEEWRRCGIPALDPARRRVKDSLE